MPPPAPGDRFADKYIVEREIGHGGMGVVLAARHEQLGQQVAIKVLLEGAVAVAEARQRFLREARVAALLDDPHVVRVFDVGETASGSLYMVMECLQGSDLRRATAHRLPLEIQEAVGYVLQASLGLAKAHAAGIVHRDLKPGNLFLCFRENLPPLLKVLDFGVSKLRTDGQALTQPEAVLGTPAYMAPEQLRSTRDVDARADLWSLGAILYKLLTGKTPYSGSFANIVLKSAAGPPPGVRTLRPEVPPQLAALVESLLSIDPARRPADARQVAVALAPFDPQTAAAEGLATGSYSPVVVQRSEAGVTQGGAAATAVEPVKVQTPTAVEPRRPQFPATQVSAGAPGAPVSPNLPQASRVQVVAAPQALPVGRGPGPGVLGQSQSIGGYNYGPVGSPSYVPVPAPGVQGAAGVRAPARARSKWGRRLLIGLAVGVPLLVLGAIGVFAGATYWFAKRVPKSLKHLPLPAAVEASRVDALEALPLARAEALKVNSGARFVGIIMTGDFKGGLANLSRGDTITYYFVSKTPGSNSCSTVIVELHGSEMHLSCIAAALAEPTVQEPKCGPTKAWSAAAAAPGVTKIKVLSYGPEDEGYWKAKVDRVVGSSTLKLHNTTCSLRP